MSLKATKKRIYKGFAKRSKRHKGKKTTGKRKTKQNLKKKGGSARIEISK